MERASTTLLRLIAAHQELIGQRENELNKNNHGVRSAMIGTSILLALYPIIAIGDSGSVRLAET